MRRVKVLITRDGRFRFEDLDQGIYVKLIEMGIPLESEKGNCTYKYFDSWRNLRKRTENPEWWMNYIQEMIGWVESKYRNCHLCHLQCGFDRFIKQGPCLASLNGEFFDLFVHPEVEEGLENVLHILVRGCSLNCFFCHKDQERRRKSDIALPHVGRSEILEVLKNRNYEAVVFSGGNPDENVLSILNLLKEAGPSPLPILWETHGCVDIELLSRLSLIIDLFIVTIKFGNDYCASLHGGVQDYSKWILQTLAFIEESGVNALIRASKMSGHEECCYPTMWRWTESHAIRSSRPMTIYPEYNLAIGSR